MNEVAIDLGQVEWFDRKGRPVHLNFIDGFPIATPRLPKLFINKGIRKSIKDLVVFASGKSNYYISKLLNQFWNTTSFTFPTPIYWAGWTATLTAASTGATAGEASYAAYARVSSTPNTTNYSTSSSGSTITNNTAITWPANATATSTWTFVAVLDGGTTGAGNILFWGSITSTAINVGDTPQMNISALTASEA